jgi:ABC-type glycerol-3-phosphate transport system permease component
MLYETQFLIALAFTSLIEVPLVYVLVRFVFKLRKIKVRKILLVALMASVLTLPYVWFVIPNYVDARNSLLVSEIVIVLIEALIFNQLLGIKIGKSFVISLFANVISFFCGLQIVKLIGIFL